MKKIITLSIFTALIGANYVFAQQLDSTLNPPPTYTAPTNVYDNLIPYTAPTNSPGPTIQNAEGLPPAPTDATPAIPATMPDAPAKPAVTSSDTYKLLEPLPCISGTESTCVSDGNGNNVVTDMALGDYIGYIYKFAIAIAAFLAVIMITWGGFQYMTTESFTGKGSAKKTIQNAATGLLMVLASYLILQTIDPRLVAINTSIPPVEIKIDTAGLAAFRSQMDADFSSVKTTSREKAKELQNIIEAKQNELNKLTPLALGRALTPAEEVESNMLKQEINNVKKEQAMVFINGTEANMADLFLKDMTSSSAEMAINNIDKNYAAAFGLLDTQKEAEIINELKKHQAFFDEQVKIQKETDKSNVKSPSWLWIVPGVGTVAGIVGSTVAYFTSSDKDLLSKKLVQYETDLKNIKVPDIVYSDILNLRIAQINKILEK